MSIIHESRTIHGDGYTIRCSDGMIRVKLVDENHVFIPYLSDDGLVGGYDLIRTISHASVPRADPAVKDGESQWVYPKVGKGFSSLGEDLAALVSDPTIIGLFQRPIHLAASSDDEANSAWPFCDLDITKESAGNGRVSEHRSIRHLTPEGLNELGKYLHGTTVRFVSCNDISGEGNRIGTEHYNQHVANGEFPMSPLQLWGSHDRFHARSILVTLGGLAWNAARKQVTVGDATDASMIRVIDNVSDNLTTPLLLADPGLYTQGADTYSPSDLQYAREQVMFAAEKFATTEITAAAIEADIYARTLQTPDAVEAFLDANPAVERWSVVAMKYGTIGTAGELYSADAIQL